MIEKDFIKGNFLDRIGELERRLGELEKTALTGSLGDINYKGDLVGEREGNFYEGYVFVPLLAPLVNTSWDGDARSTTAKTLIDLSAVFGVPAGVRGVLVNLSFRDSGAAANDCYVVLSPNATAAEGMALTALPVDDRWSRYSVVVPCNADGDIYYQIAASGAGSMDVYLQVWGYWL